MRMIYSKDSDGVYRWKEADSKKEPKKTHYIQTDEIPAVVGHATGKTYTSKSKMRREAKEVGCVESGDKPTFTRKPGRYSDSGKREIERMIREKFNQ